MRNDAGRSTVDEGKPSRAGFERLIGAARPVQREYGAPLSASPEQVGPRRQTGSRLWRSPKARLEEAGRGIPLPPARLGRVEHYILALLFVAVAASVRWALGDVLSVTPFLVFYLAWVAAAAFGGLGPGLLATLASWLCIDFLFDPTPGHIGLDNPLSIIRLLILLAGGSAVSAVGEKMRRSRIRERRQAGELVELARSLEGEKAILQSVMDGARNSHLVFLDRDFNFVRVNEAYARTCGYTPEEMIGKNYFALYPDAENEAIFARVRDTSVPIEFHDKPFVFPDQPERGITYWDWTLTPIKNGSGVVEGLVFSLFETTARKQMEETLRESEDKFKAIFDRAALGLAISDPTGRILDCNLAYQEMLDYTKGELQQKCFLEITHPDDVDKNRDLQRQLNEGSIDTYQLEKRYLRRDGRVIWCNLIASAIRNPDGTLKYNMAVAEDITERKQAEEGLRESEERYRTLFESSRDGIIFTDMEGRILRMNPYYREMLGYSEEELRALTYQQLTPRRWHETEAGIVRDKVMSCGYSGEYEKEYIRKDGTVFPISIQVWLIRDAHGQPQGMWGIVRDITERKRAEELLRESEAKYRIVADNTYDWEFWLDPEGRFLYTSPSCEQVTGYSAHEFLNHPGLVSEIIHPDDLPAYLEHRRETPSGHPGDIEFRIVAKGGALRWIHHVCLPVYDKNGRYAGRRGSNRDITERKEAEEALCELNATLESRVARRTEELEQRARQLQKLTLELTEAEEHERARIAEILHDDLQQMLAAAKFQVSLLSSRVKNDADSQEIAGQAKNLLTDAIGKSRSLSHELNSPALSQSDLGAALEWLAEQMQKKHGFTVHLEMGGRIEVASEPLRILLYKAAQEMLFNAIKHAGVQEAKLRLRRQRGCLRLSVSDQGQGFDPTDPDHKLGFGLLSIRERIELLGGRLKIRSAADKGSTFFVIVPEGEAGGAASQIQMRSKDQPIQTDHSPAGDGSVPSPGAP